MFGCDEVIPPQFLKDGVWEGTDNASWFMRQKKKIQYWMAIGPRGKHWHCKTRELPKTLFVKHGGGPLRYETTDGKKTSNKPAKDMYLSRIQCWSQWHFAVVWPLFVHMHRYRKPEDVPKYPEYKSNHGIKKLVDIQGGYKRDGDRWHILTAFLGGNHE